MTNCICVVTSFIRKILCGIKRSKALLSTCRLETKIYCGTESISELTDIGRAFFYQKCKTITFWKLNILSQRYYSACFAYGLSRFDP